MTSGPDVDAETVGDEEDLALFIQALAGLNMDYRRVLSLLMPRVVALEERGDTAGAMQLIQEVQAIISAPERPEH